MGDGGDGSSGYKRPPKHGQFKKGQSGNPGGRPKGSKSLKKVLQKTLQERVVGNLNGKRRSMTLGEAAVKQVATKAASGDLRATNLVFDKWSESDEDAKPIELAEEEKLTDADREVLAAILKRIQEAESGGGDNT